MINIRSRNDDHEVDIRFPISESELYAKLAEIHAIDGRDAPPSAFVTEVYWPEELSTLKDRFANLDELNYLAKRMESFDYNEYDQFLIGITKLENPTEKDLINLTFNLDHFTLCKDVSSYGKIGREYVLNTEGAVPANDEDDPKYAAIGKDLIDRGLAQITAKGLLKPLYRWSLQDAVAHNEVQDWRDSYRENCDCARAIERAIADHYHDNILEDGTKDIIDRYGFDRVNWVLANTLQEKSHDGRFSQENKKWAKGFFIPSDDVRWHFCMESHPGLTDLFINQAREAWQKLRLFDQSHCSEDNDYAGKLLILKPSVLKDEYKASDYQLFYAESGFGCSPTASGRKVFGKFLKDGENTNFNRSDFLGVIKDECIPEWAAEKLAELEPPDEDESEGITMGGM